MKLLSASILAVTLLAGCGSMSTMMADTPTKTSDGVLVGPDGKSLYTFNRDTANSGKSVCNAACAKLWPALPVPTWAPQRRSPGTSCRCGRRERAARA